MSTRIKFCGATSWTDVELALDAGADAVGLIFAESPRRIRWEAAREIAGRIPPQITPVAVFVNPTRDEIARVRDLLPNVLVQLSGDEPPGFATSIDATVIKAIGVGDESPSEMLRICDRYAPSLMLFDTRVAGKYGGTGLTFDWSNITQLARWRPVMVAGGLTPDNVAACVRAVRPFGVDVRSGIETDGHKDLAKMRAFVRAVRESDAAA
ncbi:MAG TPA: phosphoribosylanthranilate isomerase [Candidatus Aquilonibacter sp.]|nr:phosphoribosylanthranilate isomerase [Candidatus Aquilonibacter sp.]